ncbi:hypothetical protein IFM51744_11017 [Aspergillus udagawae]|nr:hypothetical protein IFM51744_11017 [Aspergillus udagawae]
MLLRFVVLPLFKHFNHTFSHLSERFLKVAGARFLLPTVMFKTAFLIGETRVGELQLMVFPLKARAVGMLRYVGFPQPSVKRHQARSLFCKHRVLVVQSLQLSNQRSERLSSRGSRSGRRNRMGLVLRHLITLAIAGACPVAGGITLPLDWPSLNVEVAHGATHLAGSGVALNATSSRTHSSHSWWMYRYICFLVGHGEPEMPGL